MTTDLDLVIQLDVDYIKQNWDNATWPGSRRVMIRQSLKLTVRERL